MLTARRRLIPVVALVVALGVAVVWLLLVQPTQKSVSADANVPSQPARAATLDRPRSEIRVRRNFKLEELMRFESESAPWLSGLFEEYPADGMRSGESVRPPEQVASAAATQERRERR